MKIKHFKLKEGTTHQDLINFGARQGGKWIRKDAKLFISKNFEYMGSEYSVSVAFCESLDNWDDFNNILVLDEEFCQPYTPFYGSNYNKDITNFDYLEQVIKQYNKYLSSFPFLEEISDEEISHR